MITWTCHICGDERPDVAIAVKATDISEDKGLPAGTLVQNVRYCRDRVTCTEKAQTFRMFDKGGGT